MLQIKNLTITHRKDLRVIIEDFQLTVNDGDKVVIIGEEGNGKSTLLRWIYDPCMSEEYAECSGERILGNEILGYLPQELPQEEKEKTLYEYFSKEDCFFDLTPKELANYAREFSFEQDIIYSDQKLGSLSGGEKIKVQLMKVLMKRPTVLLLDEPSNDIDMDTLEWLEQFINHWEKMVLFISHDETLIENTANMVVHIEQIQRKTKSRVTVAKMGYSCYVNERLHSFERQMKQAINDEKEKKIRDEKFHKIQQSVEHAQNVVSRQCPAEGRLLKKKMNTIKAMEGRFQREDENMTKRPEAEDAIFFKLGGKEAIVPAGKMVVEYELDELTTPDESRTLARDIFLRVRGPEKICIVGTNGVGKTTLLRKIANEMMKKENLIVEYMPQNYEDLLDMDKTPIEFLDNTGDKETRTRIRTYLGSLKYTPDEMEHPIRELSGGQKAKVLFLKMSLSKANVLILDEPTRNFSPLSGPVIRKMLSEFEGAIISISHDRKYMEEVCDKIYYLTSEGLKEEQ